MSQQVYANVQERRRVRTERSVFLLCQLSDERRLPTKVSASPVVDVTGYQPGKKWWPRPCTRECSILAFFRLQRGLQPSNSTLIA